ncbi:hypothetical protein T552_02994 [Pneumocystis carinii B80]|uniref:Ribosomal eL28/Mak16 domain-containing protein n=1 Tax=Pneumocystis carinii (strain B80) TaxID=1408658 RepID=A0A0W4ZCL6_PNEC8|nr:hypothetical protein T552_02994 [Pneumocystis carinii B80]KTW26099.1 hypothetical protein T552_02994 [Pneumocystis carinii B80]
MGNLKDNSLLNKPNFYESLSGDVVWSCLKKNASFLVKQRVGKPVVFSREKVNLVNKHVYSYCGLLNDKGLGIESGKNNKGLVVFMKNCHLEGRNRPSSMLRKVYYGPKSHCYTVQRIKRLLVKKEYSLKLQSAAISRAALLLSSQTVKKPLPEKKSRKKV